VIGSLGSSPPSAGASGPTFGWATGPTPPAPALRGPSLTLAPDSSHPASISIIFLGRQCPFSKLVGSCLRRHDLQRASVHERADQARTRSKWLGAAVAGDEVGERSAGTGRTGQSRLGRAPRQGLRAKLRSGAHRWSRPQRLLLVVGAELEDLRYASDCNGWVDHAYPRGTSSPPEPHVASARLCGMVSSSGVDFG